MNTDLTDVIAQKKELDNKADELAEIHTGLVRYRNQLDGAWAATEIVMIDEAIERLNRRISRAREELGSIGVDMLRAADDIVEEAAVCEKEEQRASEEKRAADRAVEEKAVKETAAKGSIPAARGTVNRQSTLQAQRTVKSNSAMKKIFAFLK